MPNSRSRRFLFPAERVTKWVPERMLTGWKSNILSDYLGPIST